MGVEGVEVGVETLTRRLLRVRSRNGPSARHCSEFVNPSSRRRHACVSSTWSDPQKAVPAGTGDLAGDGGPGAVADREAWPAAGQRWLPLAEVGDALLDFGAQDQPGHQILRPVDLALDQPGSVAGTYRAAVVYGRTSNMVMFVHGACSLFMLC